MCGIVGIISTKNVSKELILALRQLENRGYDSAGIATIESNNHYYLQKYASTNILAISKLKDIPGCTGIGHTRWATHGAKTDINAHPHLDYNKRFFIVHNGIIENFEELKADLKNNGVTFTSETDTEIIANLLQYEYQKYLDVKIALKKCIKKLRGTWGLIIMDTFDKDKLYVSRNGSPVIIGRNSEAVYITSEQSGFCGKIDNYISLENGDIAIITINTTDMITTYVTKYKKYNVEVNTNELTLVDFKHWMEKEIKEQDKTVLRTMGMGGRLTENGVKLGGLDIFAPLKTANNLIMLGCGTSYHAGMYAKDYFNRICNFNTVQAINASEFSEYDIPKVGSTVVILISQSGETKDLLDCIHIARAKNCMLVGVINCVGSQIARDVDCGVYLNAGREVAVASTKAFSSQVTALALISIWFSSKHDCNSIERNKLLLALKKLPDDIEKTISNWEASNEIIKALEYKQSIFILGKGRGEAIAKEGSLKIKEIAYVHSEGYSASSLKHGPFGMLEEGFPVILNEGFPFWLAHKNFWNVLQSSWLLTLFYRPVCLIFNLKN